MQDLAAEGVLERLAEEGVCHIKAFSAMSLKLTIEDSQRQAVMECMRQEFSVHATFEFLQDGHALFTLTAASLFNIGAGYELRDSASGELVGIIARQAAKSLLWDSWVIYGPDGAELARVSEDSVGKYLLRKFLLGPLLPMSHVVISPGGMLIGRILELVGVFVRRHKLELHSPDYCPLDFRLLLATATLLARIQSRAEDPIRTMRRGHLP